MTPSTGIPPTRAGLFAAAGPSLLQHRRQFGPLPAPAADELIAMLDAAGLTGRGGAGFPTGRKIASMAPGKAVVIGNGAEGEPLSIKDATLLARAPHLVLDGLHAVAAALAADSAFIYVGPQSLSAVRDALEERIAANIDSRRITLVEAPDTFIAGEESAVIRRIEGGPALPRDRTAVTTASGFRGCPTLVNNVETLAHIALIIRYGPRWFRSVGVENQPGTMLVSLSGALHNRGVVETNTGVSLRNLLERMGGTDSRGLQAVLLGGYHGSWIPAAKFDAARLSRGELASMGASPGAGIVHALGRGQCGLIRTAEIVTYLAEQSARQCGPCRNGLPRLATQFEELAYGQANGGCVGTIARMVGLIDGRGSCRHPDGAARLIRSALGTFAADVHEHRHGLCVVARSEQPRLRRPGVRA